MFKFKVNELKHWAIERFDPFNPASEMLVKSGRSSLARFPFDSTAFQLTLLQISILTTSAVPL